MCSLWYSLARDLEDEYLDIHMFDCLGVTMNENSEI
jgi:hypothetical protein